MDTKLGNINRASFSSSKPQRKTEPECGSNQKNPLPVMKWILKIKFSGKQDLNLRPQRPERRALPAALLPVNRKSVKNKARKRFVQDLPACNVLFGRLHVILPCG